MTKKLLAIAAFSFCTLALAAPSQAQHSRGSAPAHGTAAPRGGVAGGAPSHPIAGYPGGHPGGGHPYYGYGHYYGGYPYYYSPYYYPWGIGAYYGGYYGSWGLSVGVGYGYPGYGYPYYPYYGGGYAAPSVAYGGVRITDAPKGAQVFADGYYVGIVDDFDSSLQQLSLQPGAHHVEIHQEGQPPTSFDVNVLPGETITYHAK